MSGVQAGYGVAVEARLICSKCKAVVHMNALVDRFVCPTCSRTIPLGPKVWRQLLGEVVREARTWPELVGKGTLEVAGDLSLKAKVARQDPRFRETQTPVAIAAAEKALDRGFLENPHGSAPVTVREVPEAYRSFLPDVAWLLGEDAGALRRAGALAQVPDVAKVEGLALSCVQCGASSDIREAERLVRCTHCGATAFVGDEVWQRVHPDPRSHRWYLWVRGRPEPRVMDVAEPDVHDHRRLPPVRPRDDAAAFWFRMQVAQPCATCNAWIHLVAVAPTFSCPECFSAHEVSDLEWADLIMDLAARAERSEGHYRETMPTLGKMGDIASAVSGFQRHVPRDAAGRELTRDSAALAADAPSSADPLVRRVPARYEPWLSGVEFLAGESRRVLSGERHDDTVAGSVAGDVSFACPRCGGALAPDGSERIIVCSYCDSAVGIDDRVWALLNPPEGMRWFHVLYNPQHRVVAFDEILAIAGGPDGGLLVYGRRAPAGPTGLFALDRSLRLLWVTEDVAIRSPQLSWKRPGEVVVWECCRSGGHEVHRYDVRTGARLGQAKLPTGYYSALGPDGALWGVGESDGEDRHRRVQRVSIESGRAEPVWPVPTGIVASFGRFLRRGLEIERTPRFSALGERPHQLSESNIEVAPRPNGQLVLQLEGSLATYQADGAGPQRTSLGFEPVAPALVMPDGSLLYTDAEPNRIVRVSVEGEVEIVLDPVQHAGEPVGWLGCAILAVDDEGTITVADVDGGVRRYSADFELQFQNARAREMAMAAAERRRA